MKDIYFCETDVNTIKNSIITTYETLADRTLARGDPLRLWLEAIAAIIVQQRLIIDNSAKMNLLYYATGDYLDHIGYLYGAYRNGAAKATTKIKVTLSAIMSVPITVPAGTRVGDASSTAVFATDEDLTIIAGETIGYVDATSTSEGTASNGYGVGEIKNIIDPIAYVATMVNTTATGGGAEIEDDESYRERIRLAPESFSVAGPTGAYEYWTKTASSLIGDVGVVSPEPGKVTVYPLLKTGDIPDQEILDKVLETLNDKKIRPLTDIVEVLAPESLEYDVDVKYFINDSDKVQETAIIDNVSNAVDEYIAWQKTKMGRDINPSMLIQKMVMAGAKRVEVTSPVFTNINDNAVAAIRDVSVNYGGVEDD